MFQNGGPRHRTFPTLFLPLKLSTAEGAQYKLSFKTRIGTRSDAVDQFTVHLLQFTS